MKTAVASVAAGADDSGGAWACEAPKATDASIDVPFPFGLYSAAPGQFATLKQSGFTLVGPYYGPVSEEIFAAAERVGLGVIHSVGAPRLPFADHGEIVWAPQDVTERVTEQVQALKGRSQIRWWYLTPEELRPWRAADMAYLEQASAAVRDADPERRPIFHYQPNNRRADQLSSIAAHLGRPGRGLYANHAGFRDQPVWVRWGARQLVLGSGAHSQAVAVPEMFEQPPPGLAGSIRDWARHDVYAAIVAGVDAVVVFSGFRRPQFAAYDAYMAAYSAVATELNGPLRLGAAVRDGSPCQAPLAVTDGPATTTLELEGERWVLPAVSTLAVAHGGGWTLLVVNSSLARVTVAVSAPRPAATLRMLWGLDDRLLPGGGVAVVLPPMGVAAMQWDPAKIAR